jgi:hypothetical protein
MTYYVLVFMRVGSRQICLAGLTLAQDAVWMNQMARNLTMAGQGMLDGCRYLLRDRDTKFSGDLMKFSDPPALNRSCCRPGVQI